MGLHLGIGLGTSPRHVGIIMDGNGRWAEARGLTRYAGHRAGADAARRTVEAAPGMGIQALTLYAFSSDNWGRPSREVRLLMSLFQNYLSRETPRCLQEGIRIAVIGRRDRLSPALRKAILKAERVTGNGRELTLRLAVDYSARDSILTAAFKLAAGGNRTREEMDRVLAGDQEDPGLGRVDMVIRTGGEQRLSDFLLWESAYAELLFMEQMWPDFGPEQLEWAVAEFRNRDRRFGRVGKKVPMALSN